MHAVGFSVSEQGLGQLSDVEMPEPELRAHDVLVKVKAVSVNPVDVKVRQRTAPNAPLRVLGFDAAGVIVKTGEAVQNFSVGDEVFYAGTIDRAGSNAELQAVDSRIIARKPKTLDFAQAAALPLTALTAWEALFDRLRIHDNLSDGNRALLILGAAGGVGSMAVQLAKALSDVRIIASASRKDSQAWVESLGADIIVNHHENWAESLAKQALAPQFVFSTQYSDTHLAQIAQAIAPQGHFALIDDPEVLDIKALKSKSISLHWEFMFTRPLFGTKDIARQGEILAQVADLIDKNIIKTTARTVLEGINAETLETAHRLISEGNAIGKIVIRA